MLKSGAATPGEWIVHSGALSHMYGNEDFFKEMTPITGTSVTLADGNVAEVKAKGTGIVTCKHRDGKQKEVILSAVLHVPELKTNLVSEQADRQRG